VGILSSGNSQGRLRKSSLLNSLGRLGKSCPLGEVWTDINGLACGSCSLRLWCSCLEKAFTHVNSLSCRSYSVRLELNFLEIVWVDLGP
jgi:hypothetical protein